MRIHKFLLASLLPIYTIFPGAMPTLADPVNGSYRGFLKDCRIRVFASYPSDPDQPVIDVDPYIPGQTIRWVLPPSQFRKQQPTDEKTIYICPDGVSSTTLYALKQTNSFVETPLFETYAEFGFINENEFLVPSFSLDSGDLFVGIDLTQYLANPINFNFGDIFSFVNGVNPSLPGYLVGTSEIFVDTNLGLTTLNPYTGAAPLTQGRDGSAIVPEPTSTLSLLALGTLGAASTLKRKLKPSKSTGKETTKVG